MKIISVILIALTLSTTALAGNGVERGSVMIKGNKEISSDILNYLSKQLTKCSDSNTLESFSIKNLSQRNHKVDQGIIDVYYRIDLIHQDQSGKKLNDLTIEVLDSDFDNWRQYEEKLSMEIINDQNNFCI